MIQAIPFPALKTPVLLISIVPVNFLWIAPSIAEADSIVANGAKNFLANRTQTLISGPAHLPNKALESPPI